MQWIDRDGKTPLILACLNSELHHVAKTLIELGANVNAYRRGMCLILFFFPFSLFHLQFGSFVFDYVKPIPSR